MLKAWRLVNERHRDAPFSGEGARLFGGRWNSPGTSMIYTAESRSLAVLETLVHLDSPELLKRYILFSVEIDVELIRNLDRLSLPRDWQASSGSDSCQEIGDVWAASRSSVALSVPSTIIPDESNFLFNPSHPDFSKLHMQGPSPFQFDPRLAMKRR